MLHQCLSSRSCCWVQIPAISSNPVLSVSRRVTDSSGRSFPQATFRASFDEWPVLSDIQQARSMSCHHFTPAGLWTRICHVRWLAAGMIMYSLMLYALDTNFLRPPPPPSLPPPPAPPTSTTPNTCPAHSQHTPQHTWTLDPWLCHSQAREPDWTVSTTSGPYTGHAGPEGSNGPGHSPPADSCSFPAPTHQQRMHSHSEPAVPTPPALPARHTSAACQE